MTLRIIGGEFRRRKLRTNQGLVTRPITDRMKESLFEHLGNLEGERVADVFAGTGTLGLEALSRGAASTVFFEQDRKAHGLLQSNVEALELRGRAFCWKTDVRRTSFRPVGLEPFYPYSLIFFDPPYPITGQLERGKVLAKAIQRLEKSTVSSDEARLILRVPRDKKVETPEGWECFRELKISSSDIRFCTKVSVSSASA